jgi:methyl-accepting chemotaxis protein
MSEVEQRVVQMKFDNAQFEAGVQQTLQSLEKLNKSIEDNTKSNKSLSGLSGIFETIKDKLTSTEDSVKSLTNAFSPLGIAGKAAIENITNKLTNFTIQAAKTLSGFTSMQAGWEKFGQKSKAVSDLMNATGASMSEVTECMDELNWFTDETSYNFTDMVSTMAKLSASGEKDLSKLLSTTEGIALWGAKAGANASTVSRAMYQLTQAVGRGYITYQDWLQSAVNTNMATDEMKKQLIAAGGAAAIAAGANEDFNTSLKEGWLTIDVFSDVMSQYTQGVSSANYADGEFINSQNGATDATTAFSEAAFRNAQECKTWADVVDAVADSVSTGWMTTFELIFGNYEEAKALWTGLANLAFEIAGKFSTARNSLFSEWKDLGGRTALLQSLVNVVNALYRIVKPVIEAFHEIFGGIDAQGLVKATNSLENFTATLKITKDTMIKIKAVFMVVFKVIQVTLNALAPFKNYIAMFIAMKTALSGIKGILIGGLGIGGVFSLLKAIVALGLVSYIAKTSSAGKGLQKVLSAIGAALGTVLGLVAALIQKISKSSIFKSVLSVGKSLASLIAMIVSQAINGLSKVAAKVKSLGVFSFIKKELNKIPTLLSTVFKKVATFFEEIVDGVKNKSGNIFTIIGSAAEKAFKPVDLLSNAFKVMTTILEGLKFVASGIFNMLTGGAVLHAQAAEIEGAKNNIHTVSDTLEDTASTLESTSSSLKGVSNSVSSFSDSVNKAKNTVTNVFDRITTALTNFRKAIKELTGIDLNWQKIVPVVTLLLYAKILMSFGNTAKRVGANIEACAKSFETFTSIPINRFFNKTADAAESLSTFLGTLSSSIKAQSNVQMFKAVALGIAALAASLLVFAYIPWTRLVQGAVVLTVLGGAVLFIMKKITAMQEVVNPVNVLSLAGAVLMFVAAIQGLAITLGIIALVTNRVITTSEGLCETLGRLMAPIVVLGTLVTAIVVVAHTLAACTPAMASASGGLVTFAAGVAAFGASLIVLNVGVLSCIATIGILTALFIGFVAAIKLVIDKLTVTPALVLAVVGAFAAFVTIFVAAYVTFKAFSTVTLGVAKSIALLAAALLGLAVAAAVLSSVSDQLGGAAASLASIMAVLGAFFVAMAMIPQAQIGLMQVNTITSGLLRLAAAVLVLSVALGIIVKMMDGANVDAIWNGIAGIATVLLSLAAAVKIMDSVGVGKVAAGVLSLVVALYMLIPIIALFSIDWTLFAPGLLEVCGLLVTLGVAIGLAGRAASASTIGTIVAMVAAVGVLTAGIIVLSENAKDLAPATAAITVAMVGLATAAVIMAAATKIISNGSWLKFAGTVVIMTAAIAALALAMTLLTNVPWQNILSFAAVIVAFGAAIGIVVGVIGYFSAALVVATPFMGAFALVCLSLAAAFLSFGASCALFGVGCNLIALAISTLVALMPTFTQNMSNMLTMFSTFSQNAEQLSNLAGSLKAMAAALLALGAAGVVFGVGATAAGVGLAILAAGLIAITGAIYTAVKAFTSLVKSVTAACANIGTTCSQTLGNLGSKAKTWGKSLAANFATGILSGVALVGKAALAIAKKVWSFIHHSEGPEEGPLSGGVEKTWGFELVKNFVKGITSGDSILSTGLNKLLSKFSGLKDKFGSIGGDCGSGFLSKLSEKISGGLNKLTSWLKEKTGFDLGNIFGGLDLGISDDSDAWSLEDIISDVTGAEEDGTEASVDYADALDEVSDSASGAGSSASGAADSTSDLAEKQKVLAKYTKYANSTMTGFMQNMGNVMSVVGQSDLIDTTTAAFNELTEAIYQGTLEDSDAIDEAATNAEDRAQAVMEAFNEAFESVRDSAKDALDFFSSFDKSLSDVISPKEMLSNFESQSKGIEAFYSRLQILAGKGFSFDIIKSLMDEGTSAYPKVVGMLQATAEEVEKLNAAWDSKEAIANQAAVTAMVSLMTAQQVSKLRTVDAARKESVNTANDALKKYKKAIGAAQEANLDMEETLKMVQEQAAETGETMIEAGPQKDLIDSYKELQTAMLAAGLSNEELQEAMTGDDGFVFQENAVLKVMDRITELQTVIAQFEDIGTGVYDTTKSILESSISYFDEWSSSYELTADKLMANVQSQVQGVGQMMSQINTIVSHEAGARIFAKYGDSLTAEIVNAMSTMGDAALSTLETNLDYLAAAPVAGATAAQASWLQYGTIGGLGYQQAITQLAQNQALLNQSQSIGTNVGQGLVNGMQASTGTVTTQGTALGQAAIDGVATGAGTHSPSRYTYRLGQYVDQGLMNGMRSLSSTLNQTARSIADTVVSIMRQALASSKFEAIGRNICRGLINGMNSESWSVISTARSIAQAAYEAACAALDVCSPSKKMEWVGQMFDQGFANGVDSGSGSLQNTVTNAMTDALQTAVDLMENSGDLQPTIRPVIDLSDAQNGSRLLSSMFDEMPAFGVRASLGSVVTPSDRMNAAIQGMNGNSASFGDTIINITAAPGQDEKAIANAVIKRINNEYARRKAAWT